MEKRFTLKNIVMLILILVFCFSFVRQEVAMRSIKKEILSKQQELEKLKEKNDRLRDEVDQSKTDAFIEKMARDRLGMIKEGEKSVINSVKK
jgi:cell division protein FtsB